MGGRAKGKAGNELLNNSHELETQYITGGVVKFKILEVNTAE